MAGTNSGHVGSVERAFTIVEMLKEKKHSGVSELAAELDLPVSTVHNHLNTLERQGYVVKQDGEYEIGLKFIDLGEHARRKKKGYTSIRSRVEEIAEETEERAQFVTEEKRTLIHVFAHKGEHGVRIGKPVGTRRKDFTSLAAGKVILAYLPDSKSEEILSDIELPKHTENTITDREELSEELETVSKQGYAVNDEEHLQGLRAVAVPISPPSTGVMGALSVSGPAERLRDERFRDRIPNLLLGYSNEIEINIENQ